MGTFHSFISEPLHSLEEVDDLRRQIKEVFKNSDYNNSEREAYYKEISSFYVVYGIYKNLGSVPVELYAINKFNLVSVSNENDYFQIENNK